MNLYEEPEIDSVQLDALCADGLKTINEAQAQYGFTQFFVGVSGGNDSVATAYLASQHKAFAGCFHIVTGTGIEETTEYVTRLCARNCWPLQTYQPPVSYRELVLKWGFPGPAWHGVFYQRLKDRCIYQLTKANKRHARERIGIITGVRKLESARRFGKAQKVDKVRAQIWINPLFQWNRYDVADYLLLNEAEVNPVVQKLGFSGECLCGAFAQPGELELIREHYPEKAREIEDLQEEVAIAGKHCIWGTRPPNTPKRFSAMRPGALCSGCMFAEMAEQTASRADLTL